MGIPIHVGHYYGTYVYVHFEYLPVQVSYNKILSW